MSAKANRNNIVVARVVTRFLEPSISQTSRYSFQALDLLILCINFTPDSSNQFISFGWFEKSSFKIKHRCPVTGGEKYKASKGVARLWKSCLLLVLLVLVKSLLTHKNGIRDFSYNSTPYANDPLWLETPMQIS